MRSVWRVANEGNADQQLDFSRGGKKKCSRNQILGAPLVHQHFVGYVWLNVGGMNVHLAVGFLKTWVHEYTHAHVRFSAQSNSGPTILRGTNAPGITLVKSEEGSDEVAHLSQRQALLSWPTLPCLMCEAAWHGGMVEQCWGREPGRGQ